MSWMRLMREDRTDQSGLADQSATRGDGKGEFSLRKSFVSMKSPALIQQAVQITDDVFECLLVR